jgi:hypothetical protein
MYTFTQNMRHPLVVLLALFTSTGVAQEIGPTELVGKKVIIGRLPLCQPNTFTADISHSGKQATVVSAKPSKSPQLPNNVLNRMPPESRAMFEDLKNAATLLFEFEDGTKLDSCAPIGPKRIAESLELAPGQIVEPVAKPVPSFNETAAAPSPGTATAAQDCPVVVTKVSSSDGGFAHALADAMTTSEFQKQLDSTLNGGKGKHYLDMRMKNVGSKDIRAVESAVVYSNAMGDENSRDTLVTQNTKPFKVGRELKSFFMDRTSQSANGRGDITIYIQRVRFEDNTFWQDHGSRSCKLTSAIK